jgi:hypothetical protein
MIQRFTIRALAEKVPLRRFAGGLPPQALPPVLSSPGFIDPSPIRRSIGEDCLASMLNLTRGGP